MKPLRLQPSRLQPILAALLLSLPASGQGFVETFSSGSNAGGWTGGNGADQIESSGGNPGAYLHNDNLDTFAPQPHTTLQGSFFTGDWRARGITSFGIDLITLSTQFAFQRECTLLLSDGNGCSVYFLGTDFVPQPGTGWKSFEFSVDAASPTIPAGWFHLGSCSDANAAWNAVVQDVQSVTIFYGDPTFFFIFDIWDFGLDNARIQQGLGHSYCTTSQNSTGQPCLISASGSTSIALENLTLEAGPIAAHQGAIFYYGPIQVDVPIGNGHRCVGGGTTGLGRLPIVSSGFGDHITYTLDYDNPPTAATTILAGSTWNFQAWYRDPISNPVFNFSDGLELSFHP